MAACPNCNGTGWKIVEREEISGAVRCECIAEQRANRFVAKCELPPLYENTTFDNFSTLHDPELTQVFLAVRSFARNFPDKKRPGLLLIGDPGCGKTHLAVAAFRTILAKGFEGRFVNYQHLLDSINAGYDSTANSSDREAYQNAMDKDVLLVDDLGAQRNVNGWVEDVVTSIITYRCNHGKALIATTNLPDPDAGYVTHRRSASGIVSYATTLAERVGPRARSRLFEMCRVIKMPLIGDYRVRKESA